MSEKDNRKIFEAEVAKMKALFMDKEPTPRELQEALTEDAKDKAKVVNEYEGYRKHPVTVEFKEDTPYVFLDSNFMSICHDYGRFLYFSDYDLECAYNEATDFVTKLTSPVVKVKRDAKQYEREAIARTFGIAFSHLGFTRWEDELNEENIEQVSETVIMALEESGILRP